MSSELLKKIYIKCCSDELRINKPGNHSSFSKILGMSEHKFRYAATISAKFLADPKLSLGESIYLASKNCKIILNSNYNLVFYSSLNLQIKNLNNPHYYIFLILYQKI